MQNDQQPNDVEKLEDIENKVTEAENVLINQKKKVNKIKKKNAKNLQRFNRTKAALDTCNIEVIRMERPLPLGTEHRPSLLRAGGRLKLMAS